jgi:hypothetical protein
MKNRGHFLTDYEVNRRAYSNSTTFMARWHSVLRQSVLRLLESIVQGVQDIYVSLSGKKVHKIL